MAIGKRGLVDAARRAKRRNIQQTNGDMTGSGGVPMCPCPPGVEPPSPVPPPGPPPNPFDSEPIPDDSGPWQEAEPWDEPQPPPPNPFGPGLTQSGDEIPGFEPGDPEEPDWPNPFGSSGNNQSQYPDEWEGTVLGPNKRKKRVNPFN